VDWSFDEQSKDAQDCRSRPPVHFPSRYSHNDEEAYMLWISFHWVRSRPWLNRTRIVVVRALLKCARGGRRI